MLDKLHASQNGIEKPNHVLEKQYIGLELVRILLK